MKKKNGKTKKEEKRKKEKEKETCFPETNSKGKGKQSKREGNWSMVYATTLFKLSLIMAFNVQENVVFIHEFFLFIFYLHIPWKGEPSNTLSRSVASLPRFGPPLPPVDKSWLHHALSLT